MNYKSIFELMHAIQQLNGLKLHDLMVCANCLYFVELQKCTYTEWEPQHEPDACSSCVDWVLLSDTVGFDDLVALINIIKTFYGTMADDLVTCATCCNFDKVHKCKIHDWEELNDSRSCKDWERKKLK